MRAVNFVLEILFARRMTALIFDLGATVGLVLIATAYLRQALDSTWASVAIVVGLEAFVQWLGWLAFRHQDVLARLVDGPPAFGPLGGLQRSTLRTVIRTSQQLRVDFDPADRALVDRLSAIDLESVESMFKKKFLEVSNDTPETEVEEEWRNVWENEVLAYTAGNATLHDTFGAPSYASIVMPIRLLGVRNLVSPIFKVFQILLLWIAYRYLNGEQSLLTVLQIGLVFSLTISMVIYLNHSIALSEIEVIPSPEVVPDEFREQANQLVGRKVMPTRIMLKTGYFESVGRFFLRSIAFGTLYNSVLTLGLIAISLVIGLLAAGDSSEVLSSYRDLSVAVLIIPFAIMLSHYVATLLVQYLRHLAAAVIGGALSAFVPFVVDYSVHGHVSASSTTIISSAVTGTTVALVTAVATLLTNRVGSPPETASVAPA
jgi:hypothetical protein